MIKNRRINFFLIINVNKFQNNSILDAPLHGQLFFQDPATLFAERAIDLHHDIMSIMIFFFVLILWFLSRITPGFKDHTQHGKRNLTTFRRFWYTRPYKRLWRYKHLDKLNAEIDLIHEDYLVYWHDVPELEIFWTLVPTTVVVFIAIPSFNLLYLTVPLDKSSICVKVTGSQWFWTYEYDQIWTYSIRSLKTVDYVDSEYLEQISRGGFYSQQAHVLCFEVFYADLYKSISLSNTEKLSYVYKNMEKSLCFAEFPESIYIKANSVEVDKVNTFVNENKVFQSNIIPTENLELGEFRLLEVDQLLVIPRNTHISFSVTSTDVLHSWSIPSLGIKIDACPGRLNEVSVIVYRNSVYYGQCSEICGVLHGFMPIVIRTVNLLDYYKYLYLNNLK